MCQSYSSLRISPFLLHMVVLLELFLVLVWFRRAVAAGGGSSWEHVSLAHVEHVVRLRGARGTGARGARGVKKGEKVTPPLPT